MTVQEFKDKKQIRTKKMMSDKTIYGILQWLPIAVSAVFFVINVIKSNTAAMIAIGICLGVFIVVNIGVNKGKLSFYHRKFIVSLMLPTLVFMISLFSGASYSDDFPLMLAVLALSGMLLEPKITLVQMILADVYLVLMYVIHPEKAGELSQYILCSVCFALAGALFFQVIRRGRSFIEMTEVKAAESDALLKSIRDMGAELQEDFDNSAGKIEVQTLGLQRESMAIAHDAGLVSESCGDVQEKITESKIQIQQLDAGVKQFEAVLVQNRDNVQAMNTQVEAVSRIIGESGAVFKDLEEQMQEIAGVARQISDISFRLTILSLNAAVEAAHAGEFGVGFEVVAAEMRSLSETSAGFSDRVSDVVKELLVKVDKASGRVTDSRQAFLLSKGMMVELTESFSRLHEQFGVLYDNIEGQNVNVGAIDDIFADLERKVADMQQSVLSNQESVEGIADAMLEFSENIGRVVENTRSV